MPPLTKINIVTSPIAKHVQIARLHGSEKIVDQTWKAERSLIPATVLGERKMRSSNLTPISDKLRVTVFDFDLSFDAGEIVVEQHHVGGSRRRTQCRSQRQRRAPAADTR